MTNERTGTFQPYWEATHPNHGDGIARLYWFEGSQYGASAIRTTRSYGGRMGLWEVCILRRRQADNFDTDFFHIETAISGGETVRGWLSDEALQGYLQQISQMDEGTTVRFANVEDEEYLA